MHATYPSSTHIGSSPTPVTVVPLYAIVLYLQLCLCVGQIDPKRWAGRPRFSLLTSAARRFLFIASLLEAGACWSAREKQGPTLDSGCWSWIWRRGRLRSERRRTWHITHNYLRGLTVVRCTLPANVRLEIGADDVARDDSHFESSGDARLVAKLHRTRV
jgi:hypothetical protein